MWILHFGVEKQYLQYVTENYKWENMIESVRMRDIAQLDHMRIDMRMDIIDYDPVCLSETLVCRRLIFNGREPLWILSVLI